MTAEPSGTVPRVLLIDDDREFCQDLDVALEERIRLESAYCGDDGLKRLAKGGIDAVLLDLKLPGSESGLDVLMEIRRQTLHPTVVMLTEERSVAVAVEAMKRGAFDYLVKPPDLDRMLGVIERAMSDLSQRRRLCSLQRDVESIRGDMVAEDPRSLALLRQIEEVAPTNACVFITGESGSGKELVASRVHQLSQRREGPFIALNCAAFPAGLIESELFGREKGAYTGADRRKLGLFELAHGGTLFLDEVGESPLAFQGKLLRAIETGDFRRVGGEALLHADVRPVSATNRDIDQLLASGALREDLYYRLNVYPIHLSPLRERPRDILPLAHYFVSKVAPGMGKRIREISPSAQSMLREQPWRGNVRELANAIERAVIRCRGEVLDLPHFSSGAATASSLALPYNEAKAKALLAFKRDYVTHRLRESAGRIGEAAERSGVPRPSFQRMVKDCGIEAAGFRTAPDA